MDSDQITHSSYIEGPRWEDLSGFILKMGMACNVRIQILEETKSWLRKTTFYTVGGTQDQVRTFLRRVRYAIDDHNREDLM